VDDDAVAARVPAVASASICWATHGGVVFDQGKTDAAISRRKKMTPTAMVKVGANTVPVTP